MTDGAEIGSLPDTDYLVSFVQSTTLSLSPQSTLGRSFSLAWLVFRADDERREAQARLTFREVNADVWSLRQTGEQRRSSLVSFTKEGWKLRERIIVF